MNDDRVTRLDWTRWYSDRRCWPIDRNLFLADAVLRLAPKMIFPWEDSFLSAINAKRAPDLPGPLDAFDADNRPKPEIHDQFASVVLAYVSAAEYTSLTLQHSDREAWLSALRVNPLTGVASFDPAKAYASTGEVSYDHWHHAAWEAADTNGNREAGITAAAPLARAIAHLALNGDIKVKARPIGGGCQYVDLGPDDWLIDDPLWRIASCSIDIENRFSADARPTHILFVEPDTFEAAAWVYASNNPVSLIEEGIFPSDVGEIGPKPTASWRLLENKALEAMRQHLISHPKEYHRPALKRAVEAAVGKVGESIFEKARNRLRNEFEYIRDGGAPVGTERR